MSQLSVKSALCDCLTCPNLIKGPSAGNERVVYLSQGLLRGKYSNKTAPVDMKDSMVSSAVVTHQAMMISLCVCGCVSLLACIYMSTFHSFNEL